MGPITSVDEVQRRKNVRSWNEWATSLCLDHPGRFGLFAMLPMGDVDASLKEVSYAFDHLKADGIGMSTNEGDIWLGDERNWPIFEELDRRKAAVFVHPAPTSRCRSLTESYGGGLLSSPWLEFPVNTARAVLGLLAKGVSRRFPNIRFIFAHGGGVMPILLGRISGFSGWATVGPDGLERLFPEGIYEEFKKFYFECAQAYAPETIQLLERVAPKANLLFGSDFSYFPIGHSVQQFEALGLEEGRRRAIARMNAERLFPQFASC
jgi:predicted TIM-barrel fold metal-dependent hydrolase